MAEYQNNINKTEVVSSAFQTPHQSYSAEDHVSHFIKHYLWPIAMDGKLEWNEETPLFLGYRLYYYPHINSVKFDITSSLKETFRDNFDKDKNSSVINSLIKTWNRLICDINDEAVERPPYVHLIKAYHWFKLKVREKYCELTVVGPKWESADVFQTKDIIQEYRKLIEVTHESFTHNPENATKKNGAFLCADPQCELTTSASSSPSNSLSSTKSKMVACTAQATIPIPEIQEVYISFNTTESKEIENNVTASINASQGEDAKRTISEFEKILEPGTHDFLFDSCRRGDVNLKVICVDESTLPKEKELWFIGDLHGDLLALEAAYYYILKKGDSEGGIVFLGDLFDDGNMGYQLLLRLFRLAADTRQRRRICILAGNHDEALKWNEASGCFESSVVPSEFGTDLNNRIESGDQLAIRVGKAVCRLFDEAPRAVILWDGLLVAHAGIPHTDLQETITLPEHLNSQDCLSDFVWTRAHERARSRRPNRTTRGCEFGILDFEKFCDLTAKIGRPVNRMLRGHDHVDDKGKRALLYKNYRQNPILTINSLSSKLARELTGPDFRQPCVARWQPDQLPEVHYLKIPDDLILKYNLAQSH